MEITAIIPDLLPHYNAIGHFHISQSLIAAIIGNIVFFVILRIYVAKKRSGKTDDYFVQIIEMVYDQIYKFLYDIG